MGFWSWLWRFLAAVVVGYILISATTAVGRAIVNTARSGQQQTELWKSEHTARQARTDADCRAVGGVTIWSNNIIPHVVRCDRGCSPQPVSPLR